MDISIVIPTKNAGPSFKKVLDAIFSQITSYSYEVICVDSGSVDGTLDLMKEYPVSVYEINPEEFGHGRTRNFGASKGCGKYIIFITQDATPASNLWLQNLVASIYDRSGIAGAFGIHYPYPDCNVIDSRDITRHFNNFGETEAIIGIDDPDRYRNDKGYYMISSFFSDNNACIPRAIWETHPYPDVGFAEDQIWMRKMLELGFKKVYCPNAPVYHSHNYKLTEYFTRCYDEYQALYDLYGEFLIVDRFLHVPKAIYNSTKEDFKYIDTLQEKTSDKLSMKHYALWRNVFKFTGGYLGGKSKTVEGKKRQAMDKCFSQQKRSKSKQKEK